MPSLYETTAAVGDVSSSNFTTLYNSSGLSAPNTGGGAVGGNLNVAGNLTVQGTSLLQGAVTLGSTLSLPNYTFPSPDGSTDQVLVTDGSGNLYWTDVSAIPGAAYSISATTATGGANLTLADSAGGTDSVKFAGGTNITVSRTDANTITISTSADDIPNGTAAGQVLDWNGTAWIATSQPTSTTPADRLTVIYKDSGNLTSQAALRVQRDYGSTAYTAGSRASILYRIASDTQTANGIGSVGFTYDAANPVFSVATSIDNFANRTYIADIDQTAVKFNGTALTLNYNLTGAPSQDASFNVNRGTSPAASLTWDETNDRWNVTNDLNVAGMIIAGGVITTTAESIDINSDSTATDSYLNFKGFTQYLKWNNSTNKFELSNALQIGGDATVLGNYSQTGETMTINSDSTAADSYLYMKGNTEYLKWNNADTRFEFSDQLYISQAETPAIFERQVTTADVNPSELKAALRLYERVTDAANNATDDGGPTITFGRTSGTSATAQLFASMGSAWYGTTNKAGIQFNWSPNDFPEQSPGLYPTSYTLLDLGSDATQFFNNSVYIDYAHVDSTKTATSITGGTTLVFGSAHGYSANDRILYQTTSQHGLTQSAYYYVRATGLTATQCQVSLTSGGSAVALTNGTGLTLTFAQVSNRVGINTITPAYTLDVNGDAHVSGNVITAGITAGNITVGVVNDNTISTTTGDLTITPVANSNMTLSTTTSAEPVTVARTTVNTNTTTRAAKLQIASTGTPAVGLGTRLEFSTQTAPSTFVSGAYIETVSTNIGSGTEAFNMNIQLMDNGVISSKASLSNAGNLSIAGDITVNGNDIKSSTATALTLSGADVEVVGDLTVTGNAIKSSTATAILLSGGDVAVAGDLSVNGLSTDCNIAIGNQAALVTLQTITTSTATVALTTTTRNAMNGTVNIKDNVSGAFHVVNFTALRNGATAMLTTYGELYTAAALANFTADISGGTLRVLATPASTNSTTFNVVRTSIT
jgi:hypothetical protein